MERIRLLLTDSSTVYRKMFMEAAAELDESSIVTCVSGVDETLDKINRQDFDIVIIDAEIKESGINKLMKKIILNIPKALILITARPSSANDEIFANALAMGAYDYMVKPIDKSYIENFNIIKSKLMDIFIIIFKGREKLYEVIEAVSSKANNTILKNNFHPDIVIIASSTGGPMALESILSKLDVDFSAPILIVQHMPPPFIESLSHSLNKKSKLNVKVAENAESIETGTVYIAPGDMHMKIDKNNCIKLYDSPPVNGIRPAADVLFESVAQSFTGSGILAVILSGMGHDGENGLSILKKKYPCFCIAQSEDTCVVYGMPRAVVDSGLADKVLDLEMIPEEMNRLCKGQSVSRKG